MTIQRAEFGQVKDFLAQAFEGKRDTTAGTIGLEEMCRGTALFVVLENGEPIGAYALGFSNHDAGPVSWIRAAGGKSSFDLTETVLPIIEAQAQKVGALQSAITTARPGLVAKLLKRGYQVSGVTLRKNLCCPVLN